ncbi:hypothetical protein TNCV_5030951 [Trichonephila clavipes]|nr:hypothetical protein TNCV_5030951 [Trichonephila clavipes]
MKTKLAWGLKFGVSSQIDHLIGISAHAPVHSMDTYTGMDTRKVLYLGYVKRGFTLGNSTPSLDEFAGSKSAVLLRNFHRSKIRLTSRTQV